VDPSTTGGQCTGDVTAEARMGCVSARVEPDTQRRAVPCRAQMRTAPTGAILRRVLVEPEQACVHDGGAVMADRRHFLKALAVGGALIVAWNPLRRSWVTDAQPAGPDAPLVAVPPLDGTLHTDPATLQGFAEDFGRLLVRQPIAVLRPGSLNDIMTIVRFARQHRLTVAMNGQAGTDDQRVSHSQFGQAQAEAGVVIDVKPLSTIHGIDAQAGVADVDAGVRWSALCDAAAAFGLAPAVMTDYLHLSIGGTLSVGGIGGHMQKHGTQADNVLELQVVTGAGDLVTCSPRQHRRLFMAVVAGCGQVALIVRAKVRLLPAPPSALVFHLFYDDLAAYVDDQTRLVRDGRFDSQAGQLAWREDTTGWRYMIEVVKYFTPPHRPDTEALVAGLQDDRLAMTTVPLSFRAWQFRVDALVDSLKGRGAWTTPHPWINLWVPGSKTVAFMTDLAARLTPDDLGLGTVLFYPIATRQVAARLFRLPNEPMAFYLGLLRFPPADPDVLTAMLTDNRRLYDEVVGYGGTRYVIGAIPDFTPQDWQRHFGPMWGFLARAKRRYDPDNVLTPGWGMF
jgi:cytokinin dehydrogenase